MSMTLELRGQTSGWWPLTTVCLQQVEKLSETPTRRAIELLFGDDKTEDGTLRTVSRRELLDAIKEVALEVKRIPGGFQLRIPPMYEGVKGMVGAGVGGALIDGRYYAIDCFSDHWTIRELCETLPEPTPRYDSADIPTENFGTIKVRPKKSGRSDLSKLVRDVQNFLESDPSDEIQIIWG
jgi:hypothetical protein